MPDKNDKNNTLYPQKLKDFAAKKMSSVCMTAIHIKMHVST